MSAQITQSQEISIKELINFLQFIVKREAKPHAAKGKCLKFPWTSGGNAQFEKGR